MNTLAPISPDQHRPLHPADQATPLDPTEQASFNQLAENFNAPAEKATPAPQLGELAPVANPDARGNLLARAAEAGRNVGRAAYNRASIGTSALGEWVRNGKAEVAPSGKMRKAMIVGGVALGTLITFSGKAFAAAKGLETSSFDDMIQPGMGGGAGHAAAESVEAFGSDRAPGGARTQTGLENFTPWEAAPGVPDTIEPTPTPTPKPSTPMVPNPLYPSLSPFPFIEQQGNGNTQTPPANPNTPNTPANPADIQVKANQDPTKVLGKTWEMPLFDGKPENSLGGKMEGYLKNAFEANNIDPKTMTPTEKQAIVDAFIKENNIGDTRNMNVGTYKTEATGKRIDEVVKEHLTKDAEAKKTAAEKAAQAAAELAKTSVKLEDVQKMNLDISKLPKDLKLDIVVKDGDGLYRILDQVEPKLTQEQQDGLIKLMSSDKVREALIKYAPEAFMDHEFPEGHPRAGQHELWLRANGEKPLVNAEQQKLINEMYHRLLEDLEKQKKEADAKSVTPQPNPNPTPNPNVDKSTPPTPDKPTPPPSTPSAPPSTSGSTPPSRSSTPPPSTPAPISSTSVTPTAGA